METQGGGDCANHAATIGRRVVCWLRWEWSMEADKTPSPVCFEMLILHFAGDASSNYPIGSAVEVSIDASHWRGGAKFQIQIFCPWRMSKFKLEPSKPNLGCSHLSLQFQKQKRWKNPFGFSGFSVFWVPHSQIPFALARSTQAPRRARQSWRHRNFENRTDAAKPNGSVARHDNDDELAKVAANETCNRRVTYI